MENKKKTELKYYVFYKPFNVLNQFTKQHPDHITLADFLKVDKDIYPLGRLDKDSEGLLLLTNDTSINSLLLSPSKQHKRVYIVQLDDDVTDQAIQKISKGLQIKLDSGIYHTLPCTVKKLSKPPLLPERNPPVRFRQNIPTSWALIELTEGKNRQVRKMFSAVGFPVLRLVRVQVEDLKLGKLEPGKYIEISQDELFKLIKIEKSFLSSPKPEKKKFGSKNKVGNKVVNEKPIDLKKSKPEPFKKPKSEPFNKPKSDSFKKPKSEKESITRTKKTEESVSKSDFRKTTKSAPYKTKSTFSKARKPGFKKK